MSRGVPGGRRIHYPRTIFCSELIRSGRSGWVGVRKNWTIQNSLEITSSTQKIALGTQSGKGSETLYLLLLHHLEELFPYASTIVVTNPKYFLKKDLKNKVGPLYLLNCVTLWSGRMERLRLGGFLIISPENCVNFHFLFLLAFISNK